MLRPLGGWAEKIRGGTHAPRRRVRSPECSWRVVVLAVDNVSSVTCISSVACAETQCWRRIILLSLHSESSASRRSLCQAWGFNAPPPSGIWLTPPAPLIRKLCLRKQMKFIKRGPNLEVDFRYTNYFLAPDPPPPPGYSIRQPLSDGLRPTPGASPPPPGPCPHGVPGTKHHGSAMVRGLLGLAGPAPTCGTSVKRDRNWQSARPAPNSPRDRALIFTKPLDVREKAARMKSRNRGPICTRRAPRVQCRAHRGPAGDVGWGCGGGGIRAAAGGMPRAAGCPGRPWTSNTHRPRYTAPAQRRGVDQSPGGGRRATDGRWHANAHPLPAVHRRGTDRPPTVDWRGAVGGLHLRAASSPVTPQKTPSPSRPAGRHGCRPACERGLCCW